MTTDTDSTGTPDATHLQRPRAGNGRFIPSPATVQRDSEVAELHLQGVSFGEIAQRLGISTSTAHDAFSRFLASNVSESALELREREAMRLERLQQELWAAVVAVNYQVSDGRVVYRDGEPVRDRTQNIAAAAQLIKLSQRRSRLLGLDAPSKLQVEHLLWDLPLHSLDDAIKAMEAEVEQQQQRAIEGGEGP